MMGRSGGAFSIELLPWRYARERESAVSYCLSRRSDSGSGTRGEGCPLGTRDAGDGQQKVLHLWSEFAALGFLLGEAEHPIEERA
jgi:hypothetical protein